MVTLNDGSGGAGSRQELLNGIEVMHGLATVHRDTGPWARGE